MLSVPSGYHEPKGLYLLEAMASGVPVVQPNHGAFPEMLGRTGGGLLAASEQPRTSPTPSSSCGAIRRERRRLGARGAAGVRRAYTVEHMTTAMLEVYSELTEPHAVGARSNRLTREPRPVLEARAAHENLRLAGGPLTVLGDVSFSLAARRIGGSDRAVGLRQELAALRARWARTADERRRDARASDPYGLLPDALAAFRNERVGFVFQDHCLLPQCTVLENVLVPTLVGADRRRRRSARACSIDVGLGERLDHRPAAISGGEKQRVAIAAR